jgi:hypothetical protein
LGVTFNFFTGGPMVEKPSSFGHYIDAVNKDTDKILERDKSMNQPNFGFVKEFAISDIEYFKKILADAERINIHITWAFDEQQADPFHKGVRSDEFVRRLKRLVEGNPKTYEKESSTVYTGKRPE